MGLKVERKIRDWVAAHQEDILTLLRELVSIDTQNLAPEGNEQKGQLAVASMLQGLGCEVEIFEPSEVPGLTEHPQYWADRPCTGRPNVVGIRRGTGEGKSLLFSSHIDTVPVGLDAWTKNPWSGEISDGKFWGLGSYDMKAGLVASIAVVKALNDLNIHTLGDLFVESVVDEEFGGCNGTLAARLKYNADAAIVPEPTNMVVCPAHKGGLMLRVTFRGTPGSTFSPEKPVDPVHTMARFIQLVNAWAVQRSTTTPVPEIYRSNPGLPVFINQLQAGDVSLPFFSDRIPSHTWLTVWIEAYPGMDQQEVLQSLTQSYRHAQTIDTILAEFEPEFLPIRWLDGSQISKDHPLVGLLAQTYTDVTDLQATVQGAPFACDGHMFNLYSSTPMVLMGPTGGKSHAPDEYIVIEDFLKLLEVFIYTTVRWCGVAQHAS